MCKCQPHKYYTIQAVMMTLVKIVFISVILTLITSHGIFLQHLNIWEHESTYVFYVYESKYILLSDCTNIFVFVYHIAAFGFTNTPTTTGPNQCHDNVDCTMKLPYCKGIALCRNGVCICYDEKASITQQCQNDEDCIHLICAPPCEVSYCDTKTSTCKCKCKN